jgi:hypothetical protein
MRANVLIGFPIGGLFSLGIMISLDIMILPDIMVSLGVMAAAATVFHPLRVEPAGRGSSNRSRSCCPGAPVRSPGTRWVSHDSASDVSSSSISRPL